MNYSEHELQKACINWFRYQYPKFAKLIHSVPNGGFRNKREAGRLKAEGATAGYPDLCLEIARHGFHSLKIELKVGKGKLTKSQKEIIDLLTEHGHLCVVVRQFSEFVSEINNYLG